jgi:hypothetical protein
MRSAQERSSFLDIGCTSTVDRTYRDVHGGAAADEQLGARVAVARHAAVERRAPGAYTRPLFGST